MNKVMGLFDKHICTSDEWEGLKETGEERYFLDSDEYDIHDFVFHNLETNKYYATHNYLLEADGTCGDIILGEEVFPHIEYSLIYGSNLTVEKSYQIKVDCDNTVNDTIRLIEMLTTNLKNLLNKEKEIK